MPHQDIPRPTSDLLRAAARLSAKQREVLLALKEKPRGALVEDLAAALGMHANTVRGHLEELVVSGVAWSTPVPGGGRGRPRNVYYSRAPRQSAVTNEYVTLVELLAENLENSDVESARRIGRTWAKRTRCPGDSATDWQGAKEALTAKLRDMGFDPAPRETAEEVGLNACPFITPDGRRPSPVICAMHEGYLQEAAAPMRVELLDFDRPGQCGARFTPPPEDAS